MNGLKVVYMNIAAGGSISTWTSNFKNNAMDIFYTVALVICGWQVVKNYAKKSWAELIVFLIPGVLFLVLLTGIDKLKTMGEAALQLFQ